MTEPLNLDALDAEAAAEPYRFVFGAETYELSPTLDLRAIAALEAERLDEALRRLLGEEQYARLSASPATFDRAKLRALLEGYARHLGMDTAGNLSASGGWSRPTPLPSRPTSLGTTATG